MKTFISKINENIKLIDFLFFSKILSQFVLYKLLFCNKTIFKVFKICMLTKYENLIIKTHFYEQINYHPFSRKNSLNFIMKEFLSIRNVTS